MNLDTHNPSHLIFKEGNISTEILGGIRMDRLESMRVTLKVTNPIKNKTNRQNLDLYYSPQVTKFVRRTTELIGCGLQALTQHIEKLIDALEKYRLENFYGYKKQNTAQLTQKEESEALRFLRAKDLHKRTQEAIAKAGIVGEEINSLLLYYLFTSRKMEAPLHGITFSESGTGKSHLLEQVGSLIPDEDKIVLSDISAKALYYLEENELEHKLMIIEDLTGALDAFYPLRELMSKREITRLVTMKNEQTGYRSAFKQKVSGPVSICGASTKDDLYEDNANRSFLLYLDTSSVQDEKIMEYQRGLASGAIDKYAQEKIKKQLQNVQAILKPVSVINPYAEKLLIPKEILKPRRSNAHYLNFINAVAFYHQYQREQIIDERTGEVFIKVQKEDIQIANHLLKETLLAKSDRLTQGARGFYETIQAYCKNKSSNTFTSKELLIHTTTSRTSVFRYITQLQELGKISILESDPLKGKTYQLEKEDNYRIIRQKQEEHFEKILQSI